MYFYTFRGARDWTLVFEKFGWENPPMKEEEKESDCIKSLIADGILVKRGPKLKFQNPVKWKVDCWKQIGKPVAYDGFDYLPRRND
jgi:hypothetical protein